MIRPLTLTLTLTLTFTLTWTSPAHAEEPPEAPESTATAARGAPPPSRRARADRRRTGRAQAPAAAPAETVVRAAPEPVATPREDQAAAASVVLPDESPRAYDDLAVAAGAGPGRERRAHRLAGEVDRRSRLRGSNPDQVRIYVDGVPLNIAAGGGVDISTLPIGDVERVEVYRGSSPLAFGESALGGIISITTRTPGEARAARAQRHRDRSARCSATSAAAGASAGCASTSGVHGFVRAGRLPVPERQRHRRSIRPTTW